MSALLDPPPIVWELGARLALGEALVVVIVDDEGETLYRVKRYPRGALIVSTVIDDEP